MTFKSDVLDRYIRLILDSFFSDYKEKRNGYNFRCHLCGDSKKKKKKHRGWILKNKLPWMYYCHNCFQAIPVEHWMRLHFNSYYNDYMKEVFKIDTGIVKIESSPPPAPKPKFVEQEYDERKDVQYFKPILSSDDPLFVKARDVCERRMIPPNIWHKWFVCIDGDTVFRKRLVIPYIDNEGKIYSYQCRSLNGEEPKYLSRINCDDNIYNLYNVDIEKPVVILEGVIDSLFIENSVACTGLKIHDERLKKIKHRYFLLDNDHAGRKMSLELLKMGEYAFKWKPFLRDCGVDPNAEKDDVNDFIMKTKRTTIIKFNEIERYFGKNVLDTAYFSL